METIKRTLICVETQRCYATILKQNTGFWLIFQRICVIIRIKVLDSL